VFLNPNDHWLFAEGCVHEGKVSTRLGLPGIPEAAEVTAVARDLALIEQTGARAHFCHLTTAKAVHMVARAQFDGVPVTADAALPYFYLTEIDVEDFDPQCHVIPPFRTVEDRERLLHALQRNTLSAICSDHQPHEPDAKQGPFPSTEPGISGLDTLLPLSLKLVDDGFIELNDLIERLTIGPATILGLPFGTLSTGAVADICVFNPELTWQLDANSMKSQGHNTPFLGWELKGRVTYTLLAGKPVFELHT
jgi:dihydroorotase